VLRSTASVLVGRCPLCAVVLCSATVRSTVDAIDAAREHCCCADLFAHGNSHCGAGPPLLRRTRCAYSLYSPRSAVSPVQQYYSGLLSFVARGPHRSTHWSHRCISCALSRLVESQTDDAVEIDGTRSR